MKLLLTVALLCTSALAAPSGESLLNRIPSNHVPKWDILLDKEGNSHLIDLNPITEDLAASVLWNALEDVEFWLYTRANPTSYQSLFLNNPSSVQNSNFATSRPTKFIIHGWNNEGNSDVNRLLRDAFLAKTDCNVIVIDWSKGANNLVYSISRNRIDDVGKVVASFIDFLKQQFGYSTSNILVTGHSLGGQTAGIVGKYVTEGRIPNIVALDPAGPLFSLDNVGGRVDKGDGDFVEIIHSNGGELGFANPLGHVDFYPNWGFSQPGCGIDLTGACAHSRSFEYFAESIRGNGAFHSTQCSNYDEMTGLIKRCTNNGHDYMGGEPHDTSKSHGVYYVATNNASPYSQS